MSLNEPLVTAEDHERGWKILALHLCNAENVSARVEFPEREAILDLFAILARNEVDRFMASAVEECLVDSLGGEQALKAYLDGHLTMGSTRMLEAVCVHLVLGPEVGQSASVLIALQHGTEFVPTTSDTP